MAPPCNNDKPRRSSDAGPGAAPRRRGAPRWCVRTSKCTHWKETAADNYLVPPAGNPRAKNVVPLLVFVYQTESWGAVCTRWNKPYFQITSIGLPYSQSINYPLVTEKIYPTCRSTWMVLPYFQLPNFQFWCIAKLLSLVAAKWVAYIWVGRKSRYYCSLVVHKFPVNYL